jgi:arylsulfatase A-like enzyme
MLAVAALLACYGLGLALVVASAGARDRLLASALAFPLGVAASAVLAIAFVALRIPFAPVTYGAAWAALFAVAVRRSGRGVRQLGRAPLLAAGFLAVLAVAAGWLDVTVLGWPSHDTLLVARTLASAHAIPAEAPDVNAFATALHGAFFLVSPRHTSALAIALLASFLFLCAVLLHRTANRRALTLLATAAVATSPWLIRWFLTIGSSATAALMGISVAGILVLARREGRSARLALVPLAAMAMHGVSFALAAVAGVVLLALRRARATPAATREDLHRLAIACACGTAIAAGLEWALLVIQARDHLAGAGQAIRLLPLGFGNLVPYCLAASTIFLAADLAYRAAARRVRWPRLLVAAGAAVLSAPYAIWLARFTFSGPQAQAIAWRSVWIAALGSTIALGFAAGVLFSLTRRASRRWRLVVMAAAVAGSAAALVVNRAALHNEYLPLHTFVAIWMVLLAVLAGREASSLLGDRVERRPRGMRTLAIAVTATAVVAGVVLARAHGDAWLVWGHTGTSRYLARRWTFLTPTPAPPADAPAIVVKPDVDSARAAALRAERAAAPAPNIVILNTDSLRRDRVGAYGHRGRQLTPNLDRFAARGVRFTSAYTSFPATQVFNSALLLGRYVVWSSRQQPDGYREHAVTNLLDARGYHIFIKSWFDPSKATRFEPGPFSIDTYLGKERRREGLDEPLEQVLQRLDRHLEEARARGEPVLIWMHLLGAHMLGTSFVPHPAFDFGDSREDRYDSAVAGCDLWIGAVEERMKRLASDRPTVWILSADHGTNPATRSRDLSEPIVHVPLIVVAPGVEPRVDDRPVDVSLDVAATVVDLAGMAPPPEYDGVSLVPLLAGLPVDAMRQRLILLNLNESTGAVQGRFKYTRQGDAESLFDLARDPGETRNLIGERFDLAYWLADAARRELDRRTRSAAEASGTVP